MELEAIIAQVLLWTLQYDRNKVWEKQQQENR